jgi:hypothetical protein
MKYQGIIETRQLKGTIKEQSPIFDNQLQAEMWLGNVCREAKSLKVRIVDHYLISKEDI